MLDNLILRQKPDISLYRDGEKFTFKDLTCQTYKGNIENQKANIVIVDENYVARPDLISLALYGDDRYGDIICKVNGISNPFELNKNMILYVPDINTIHNILTGTKNENDVLEEFKYKNGGKSSRKKFNDTVETIEKKKTNLQKLKNERRSPGEQTIEDNNYYIDKTLGIVVY